MKSFFIFTYYITVDSLLKIFLIESTLIINNNHYLVCLFSLFRVTSILLLIMTTNKRKIKETVSQSASTSSKKACLSNLPGDTILTKDFARKLKTPDFIATLEARQWKQEASLVCSYFQHTNVPESTPVHFFFTLLDGALHRIIDNKDVDPRLKIYSTALIRQHGNESYKKKLVIEYKKLYNEYQLGELEEEAQTEARFTSRILTTVEAKYHRKNMQSKLDNMFRNDEIDGEDNANNLEQLSMTSQLDYDNEEEMAEAQVSHSFCKFLYSSEYEIAYFNTKFRL